MENKQITISDYRNKEGNSNRIVSSRYTFYNFIPKNIIHQLSKTSTLFFSITLVLLCIPSISPFEPYSYGLAFSVVIGTSMIKDAIEDYKRHQEDNEANSKEVHRLKIPNRSSLNPIENNTSIKAEEDVVCVEKCGKGDLLVVYENELVPADVVILKCYTEKPIGHCYVETSNLDGETNIKKKYSLGLYEECDSCKANNNYLEDDCVTRMGNEIKTFELEDTGETFTEYFCKIGIKSENGEWNHRYANIKNTILRGSVLKNTKFALCLVTAVGYSTKMSKSVKKTAKGKSTFEKRTETIIYSIFLIYFFMWLTTIFYAIFNQTISAYLSDLDIVKSFFTNYILYTYLIPLSLFVTIEIARIFHVYFIQYDKKMAVIQDSNGFRSPTEASDHQNEDENSRIQTARCRNSSVIEDLGLIDYILTDKTGTLTNNTMHLKKYYINNELIDVDEHLKSTNLDTLFILGMLLCTQVDILGDSYEGISQEEISILNALKRHGIILKEKIENKMTIKVKEEECTIEIAEMLEFSSARQRQSIIVNIGKDDLIKIDQNLNGGLKLPESTGDKIALLFSKGSEQKLLRNHANIYTGQDRDLVKKHIGENVVQKEDKDETMISLHLRNKDHYKRHIEQLNRNTEYRALVYGFKLLGKFDEKRQAEDAKEKMFSAMEFGLDMIGATLIEDTLQEGVEDAIGDLKENGIKIWMITGDKKETAVTCALKSRIVEDESYLPIVGRELVQLLKEEIRLMNSARNDSTHYNLFKFGAVIVYRATPSQKGQIVSCLKQLNHSCLAIGDGNNDVAMLRDANVGVGIVGKEGNQAALNSDFAIYRFKDLRRLVIYYGDTILIRFAKLTLNSFYKNLYFILLQYFYNFYNVGTGFPIYNDIFLNYFNTFYTSLIPISVVLFDKRNIDYTTYKMARCY
ncbi:P-type ATPase, partial [Enterospora canceri]